MNKFNISNFLMLLVTAIVVKAVISQSFSISEALVGISLIGFTAFTKYLEHNKAKTIEKQFDDRLKEVESKISFISGMGKSLNNRR